MDFLQPKLSIVIISHNQKNVLKRCIDSCLAQVTNFFVEIIVSDDRSNDGTREMLLTEYSDLVTTTFFNSDLYDISYTLERAALNRINGLAKATGKYLIHIDGDDYFTGTDLFQSMVDKLEAHPECTLCCQNYYQKPYNNLEIKTNPVRPIALFQEEQVLSSSDFFMKFSVGHNSSFCLRRADNIKIEDLTSTTYDDIDITFRYLDKGKIALLNKCDFVYVLYPVSSSNSMTVNEKYIMYNTYITGIPLAPAIAGVLLRKHLRSIARISLVAMRSATFPDRLIKFCEKYDLRIFKRLRVRMNLFDRFLYMLLFFFVGFIILMPFKTKGMIRLIYKLAINKDISEDVVII